MVLEVPVTRSALPATLMDGLPPARGFQFLRDALRRGKKETDFVELTNQVEDESTIRSELIFLPLKPVIFEYNAKDGAIKTVDKTEQVRRSFAYISQTMGVEFDTPRTKILESYVTRMLDGEGWDGPTRVVILNKGVEPRATVSTDGTILISQSLINYFQTLDQVVGVLAHECGHLIHRTTARAFKDPLSALGVTWFHEVVATDVEAKRLLSKVGLNSNALGDSFMELQERLGNVRGVAHTSLIQRAINLQAHSKFVPSITSAQEQITLGQEFYAPEKKTNIELCDEIEKSNDEALVAMYLKRLHQDDRFTFFSTHFFEGARPTQAIADGALLYIDSEITHGLQQSERLYLQLLFNAVDIKSYRPIALSALSTFLATVQLMHRRHVLDVWWPAMFGHEREQAKVKSERAVTKTILDFLQWELISGEQNRKYFALTNEQMVHFFDLLETTDLELAQDSNQAGESASAPDYLHAFKNYLNIWSIRNEKRISLSELRNLIEPYRALAFTKEFSLNDLNSLKHDFFREEAVLLLFEEVFGVQIRPRAPDVSKYDSVSAFLVDFTDVVQHQNNPKSVSNAFKWEIDLLADHLSKEASVVEARNEIGTQLLTWIDAVNVQHACPTVFEQQLLKMELRGDVISKFFNRVSSEEAYFATIDACMKQDLELLQHFSTEEVYKLLSAADLPTEVYVGKEKKVVSTEKMHATVLFRTLYEKRPQQQFNSLSDIAKEINERVELRHLSSCFDAQITSGWYFEDVRAQLPTLIERADVVVDIHALLTIISVLSREDATLLELKKVAIKHYLSRESSASVDEKTQLLLRYPDDCDYTDLALISEQLQTVAEFSHFLDRISAILDDLMTGKKSSAKYAIVDNLISRMGGVKEVIKSIDSQDKEGATTVAIKWFRDQERRIFTDTLTFETSEIEGQQLSIRDIFHFLKRLSATQRFALAVRLFADVQSPLSQDEIGGIGKEALISLISRILKLKQSFVKLALEGAVRNGRPDVVGLQLAQLLGPLLFKSLDVSNIDKRAVKADERRRVMVENKKQLEKKRPLKKAHAYYDYLDEILDKDAKELFRLKYRPGTFDIQPYAKTSVLAERALYDAQEAFDAAADALKSRLKKSESKDERELAQSEDINGNEVIISALERGGALFVRCLQIGSQLFDFDKPTADRLSQTLDQAEKMDDFRFRLALKTYAEQHPEFQSWITTHNPKLEKVLGGGSLYTTYAVTITVGDAEVPAVLKLLKPNSEAELAQSRQLCLVALENILQKGTAKDKEYAKLARRIVDMALQWCVDDINDPNYIKNNVAFARQITAFNVKHNDVEISQAPTYFAESYAVVEGRFIGQSVNASLRDTYLAQETRQAILVGITDFVTEMSIPSEHVADPYLQHSDPHYGNYQYIGRSAAGKLQIGIMDTRLFLENTKEDREVLQALANHEQIEFVKKFVARMCLQSGQAEKTEMIVQAALRKLLLRKVRTIFDRQTSSLGNLNVLLAELEKHGVPVPYQWQLRLRNEFMRQRAAREYALAS